MKTVLYLIGIFSGLICLCISQCDPNERLIKLNIVNKEQFQVSISPNTGNERAERLLFGNGERIGLLLNVEDCISVSAKTLNPVSLARMCIETRNVARVDFTFIVDENLNFTQSRPVFPTSDWDRTCTSLRIGRVACLDRVQICITPDPTNTNVKARDLLGDFCEDITPVPDNSECGLSQYEDAGTQGGFIPQQQIINGFTARPHEFPWQAVMYDTETSQYVCGAVIASANYVITAGHCVNIYKDNPSVIGVVLGEHTRSEVSRVRVTHMVKKITIPDTFIEEIFQDDIAILELACAISTFNEQIRPVCLPTRSQSVFTDQLMTISGFGVNASFILADTLQYFNSPILDFAACSACYAPLFEEAPILPGMLCAGMCSEELNAQDACGGDSGGPLTFRNAAGRFELQGLVSWGLGCAIREPGVYTDVFYYLDFIRANTGL